jgi:hypothetical protein
MAVFTFFLTLVSIITPVESMLMPYLGRYRPTIDVFTVVFDPTLSYYDLVSL